MPYFDLLGVVGWYCRRRLGATDYNLYDQTHGDVEVDVSIMKLCNVGICRCSWKK
jgi:hypothetical protein